MKFIRGGILDCNNSQFILKKFLVIIHFKIRNTIILFKKFVHLVFCAHSPMNSKKFPKNIFGNPYSRSKKKFGFLDFLNSRQ